MTKYTESKLSYMKYVTLNKQAIENSTECACAYCFEKFSPSEVEEYCCDICPKTRELVEGTALCPHCGIDSVIPNSLVQYTKNDLEKWHNEGWSVY